MGQLLQITHVSDDSSVAMDTYIHVNGVRIGVHVKVLTWRASGWADRTSMKIRE